MAYTNDEYKQFVKLVEGQESRDQVVRITARLAMTKFIDEHGEEKCNLMFADLTKKVKK